MSASPQPITDHRADRLDRTTDDSRTRVLYIGGVGRSGSTLLERMIDQIPGYTAVGETHHLLARGAQDNDVCGCGNSFAGCPFWQAVGEQAFGGWDQVDLEEMLANRGATDRTRLVPELILRPKIDREPARTAYVEFLARLYRAVGELSGRDVVVDSSKNLSTATVLRHVPGIDLRIVHLVRDSRGVAYSWTKKVVRPEVETGTAFMPRYHPFRPASRWLTDNLGFALLPLLKVPSLTIRYEDLLADPSGTLTEIHSFAGFGDPPDLGFVRDGAADLRHPTHSVSGNPMRFDEGPTALRPDEAWRNALPRSQARVVSAITAPLLWRYRYFERSEPIPDQSTSTSSHGSST